MLLCIKADSPDVYIGVWDGDVEKSASTWQAGRELSVQILDKINTNCDKVAISIRELSGIVVYEGPGSYTGLRISISTVNAIGYSYDIPVVGTSGDDWVAIGIKKLKNLSTFTPISPVYGGEVYTTKQKK